jgi:hypothetical protein
MVDSNSDISIKVKEDNYSTLLINAKEKWFSIPFVLICLFTISNFYSPIQYLGESFARLPFILATASAVTLIVNSYLRKEKILYLNMSYFLLIIVLFFALYSTYIETVDIERSKEYFDSLFKGIILFLLVSSIINNKIELKIYFILLTFCTFGLAYQLVHTPTWDRGRAYVADSMYGGDPNIITMVIVLTLPLAICIFLCTKSKLFKIFLLYVVFIMLLGIIEASSRGGFVALLVLSGYGIIQIDGKIRKVVAAVAIILLGGIFFARYAPPAYLTRMMEITDPEADQTGSAQARSSAMAITFDYVLTNPISEYGIGNHGYYIAKIYDADPFHEDIFRGSFLVHNNFLQLGADMGLIPLVFYILFILSLFRCLSIAQKKLLPLEDSSFKKEKLIMTKSLRISLIALLSASFFLASAYQPLIYYVGGCCVAMHNITKNYVTSHNS